MHSKIKLINICIRHKCSNQAGNSTIKAGKSFALKIVRRAKDNDVISNTRKNKSKEENRNEKIDSISDVDKKLEKNDFDDSETNFGYSGSQFNDFDVSSESKVDLNSEKLDNYNVSNDIGLRMLHRNRILNPCKISFIDTKDNKCEENYNVNDNREESCESKKKKLIREDEFSPRANSRSHDQEKVMFGSEIYEDKTISQTIEKENSDLTEINETKNDTSINRENFEFINNEELNNEKIEKEENEFAGNKEPKDNQSLKENKEDFVVNGETRYNKLNLQMISQKLYKQLFSNCDTKSNLEPKKLASLRKDLLASGMKPEEVSKLPDVDIELPPLEGKDIEEHFYNIAVDQTKTYKKIVHEILKGIPEMPDKWVLQEGWTRYSKDGICQVDHPLEDGMIFDVEVCMREGSLPTLATAVTTEAWYGWVSKSLFTGTSIPVESRGLTTDLLIPLESLPTEGGKKLTANHKKQKIIIGHNVSFDRQRIKEQYWLNCTGARFVDTMSMHIAVSGLNSYQRIIYNQEKTEDKKEDWENVTSLNGLGDVYRLYCDDELDKDPRDVFVEGTLLQVREEFQSLMKYCASDVVATWKVLKNLFPMFEERFPHPVTFAGTLELGSAYLPVNSNWNRYIEESESTFEDLNYEAKSRLARRADEVCKLMENDKYKQDMWMWDQDWSVRPVKIKAKLTKAKLQEIENERSSATPEVSDFEKYLTDGEDEENELEEKFKYLWETKHYLPAKFPHMSGYPAWYRKLCMKYSDENWAPGPQKISTSMQVAPKLLNLTWENYPLHYIKEHGWGILVPFSNDPEIETKLPLKQLISQCPLPNRDQNSHEVDYALANLQNDVQDNLMKHEFWRFKKPRKKKVEAPETFYKGTGVWCDVILDNCCWFFKLPHKDGNSKNVGNPLARDFLNKFSENVLAGLDSSASEILQIARTVSYWRNNRSRIMSQMVVWLDHENFSGSRKSEKRMRYGAIVPMVVVSGTVTRRATESTWMTASNSSPERIGSELRAMVQAPPGFNIVGADVDSQELWIASVIGDAHCANIHGATPFGWMTLIGTKSNGTDMHSVTASAVGISRDHAKIINYARIYGAGQKFAERLLKQFNPTMNESEASSKSRKMFTMTKGNKIYRLKEEFVNDDINNVNYSSWEAQRLAKVHGKRLDEMFNRGQWIGGTESAMFNRLEEIAGMDEPRTPFLNSRLSRALEGAGGPNDKYLPTKINWVVQSGAVDFLHLMLVSMRWLMRDNARFCLSFHDEIRYIVPTKFKYNAALAMHVTNLLTRAFCSSRLGIKDLPMSVAFFASVEVDTVLRKEASLDCKTPSNPHGLESGYGISSGENLDIWETLKKSGGSLGHWHSKKKRGKVDKNEEKNIEGDF